MVCGYTRGENDASARCLLTYLSRYCLRTQEGAGEVDIVCPTPFVGLHLDGVCAADDTGEAAQHVYTAEHLDCAFYRRGYLAFIAYIYGFGDDAAVGEFGVEELDTLEGLLRVHVPEGEPGCAVF